MELLIRFSILRGDKPGLLPGVDDAIFDDIVLLVNEYSLSRTSVEKGTELIPIFCSITNQGLGQLFVLLNRAGWKPNFGNQRKGDRTFRVVVKRKYNRNEIINAPLLHLPPTLGGGVLCDFVGRNGDRWIGSVSDFGCDSGEGWEQPYGTVDGMFNYFVSSMLKEELLELDLSQLVFHQLEWDDPKWAKSEFWELSSDLFMPKVEQAMVKNDEFTFYNDNCFEPVEIVFARENVEELGDFDFALSFEEIGFLERKNCGNRLLFLSQKARKAFESVGIEAEYNIVRYTDERNEPISFASLLGANVEIA